MMSQAHPNQTLDLPLPARAEIEAPNLGSEVAHVEKPARSRALDALRGLTVLLMLLVNNVSLDYLTPTQLQHAPWGGGITVADWVFPWFLFCAGVSLPLSYASSRKKGKSYRDWAFKAVTRAILLLLIGSFLESVLLNTPYLGLGVLQLIGFAGLGAALLMPLSLEKRLGTALLLLVGYQYALLHLGWNAHTPGTFEEERNLVAALNNSLSAYGLRGLPSLVPTTALLILASCVGEILRSSRTYLEKALRLALSGGLMMALGWALGLALEFNKAVWTPSYILFTGGLATVFLAALVLGVDALKAQLLPFPLLVLGSNALLAYILPILGKSWVLEQWTIGGQTLSSHWLGALVDEWGRAGGGWIFTWGFIAFWWAVIAYCNKRGWFLSV